MDRDEFVARYGEPAIVQVDFAVLRCCADAAYEVLAERFWNGDATRVRHDQVLAEAYGMDDEDMGPFTIAVNARLIEALALAGRKPVELASETAPATTALGRYIGAIYHQAMAQDP